MKAVNFLVTFGKISRQKKKNLPRRIWHLIIKKKNTWIIFLFLIQIINEPMNINKIMSYTLKKYILRFISKFQRRIVYFQLPLYIFSSVNIFYSVKCFRFYNVKTESFALTKGNKARHKANLLWECRMFALRESFPSRKSILKSLAFRSV